MKIPIEKQILFLKKLLADTKSNPSSWERDQSIIVADDIFPGEKLDSETIFSYTFPNCMDASCWIAMNAHGQIMGAVGIDPFHPEYLYCENEEIKVLLTRILYLLLEYNPNIEKIIDEYLALDQNPLQDSNQ